MLLKRHVVKLLMYIKFMILHIECPLKAYRSEEKRSEDIFF